KRNSVQRFLSQCRFIKRIRETALVINMEARAEEIQQVYDDVRQRLTTPNTTEDQELAVSVSDENIEEALEWVERCLCEEMFGLYVLMILTKVQFLVKSPY